MTAAKKLGRTRPVWRYLLVAVVFLALGIAGATALGASRTPASTPPASVVDTAEEPPAAEPVANEAIASPDGIAKTPADAVAQYLAAEQRRDHAASYALLAAPTREAVGSPAQWVTAHADLPVVTGWRFDGTRKDGDTAQVIGTVGLRPGLDEVSGLTPASAAATWQVLREDGTWRVDVDASDLLPQYLDEAGAAGDVVAWVAARRRCDDATEYDGGLLGRKQLADGLCGLEGDPQVGAARPLETPELDVLLPAFGSDAEVWARAVDVSGPAPLRVLVAPLGDEWIVVAVLDTA